MGSAHLTGVCMCESGSGKVTLLGVQIGRTLEKNVFSVNGGWGDR